MAVSEFSCVHLKAGFEFLVIEWFEFENASGKNFSNANGYLISDSPNIPMLLSLRLGSADNWNALSLFSTHWFHIDDHSITQVLLN